MPLVIFFHSYLWRIKYHTSADGKRKYLQDMDIKLKWIYEEAKNDEVNFNFIEARPLCWKDYEMVHDKDYVKKIKTGVKEEIQKYSWIIWGKGFVRAQLYAGGILYDAANTAVKNGSSSALMVEGHHAQYDHGSGFCTFNHLVVVVQKMLSEQKFSRVAIVDLDYHLGDGTIGLLSKNDNVWIFDMFGGIHKQSLRHAYDDQKSNKVNGKSVGKTVCLNKIDNGWHQYKRILENELPLFLNKAKPDIVFYVAGGDIFHEDRYGGIKGIGLGEIMHRDNFVFQEAQKRKIPIVFSMGGGYVKYSGDVEKDNEGRNKLTKLHLNTLLEVAKICNYV